MKVSRRYRTFSLRNKIFWGFLLICILSILGSGLLSFFVLRNNAIEQSATQMQKKSDAMMAALDYAVSHSHVSTDDLPTILQNEIFEISDINKQDIVLYSLSGKYLVSNKDFNLVTQKSVPLEIVNSLLKTENRVDKESRDSKTGSTMTSSYLVLKNNMLEPVAIVYFPYYHDDTAYLDVFKKYVRYIVLVDIFIIAIGIWLSWVISRNLTNTLTKFSDRIKRLTLFDKELVPIRYYHNDELGTLVKAYNKMILQIQDQKERLTIIEREHAWKEMAKQVAHEVKNPLTPMKLSVQNFARKFDVNDPKINDKVQLLKTSLVDQIDLIATVATAFSQFAQLPDKHNEKFDLVAEVRKMVEIFSDDPIFVHSNLPVVDINMDKIYLNRIITNLVTNSKQAADSDRELIVNIDIEQVNKRITIVVTDNGVGIAQDILGRIFEPNFTSKNSGMGLGLTMVRKMIEDYGGEISVNSEVGIGTRFTILLPSNL